MSITGLRRTLTSWTLTALVASPALAYCVHRPFHHGVNVVLGLVGVPGADVRVGGPQQSTSKDASVTVGDRIAGHRVSSGFGVRTHPLTGERKRHHGIDVATPVGTPLYAITDDAPDATVRVLCASDKDGGIIAVLSTDVFPGQVIKLMHLSVCLRGMHGPGDVVARSGNSGESTTGPHLHVEHVQGDGTHVNPSKPLLHALLTGKPLENDETVSTDTSLTDAEIICGVGAAEGTRDKDCAKTWAYNSHTDPGNGVRNQGTFSYQHGAASAEEADAKQLANLRKVERIILDRAEAAGVTLEKVELLSIIDQYNQAPAAALGRNGTLDRIIDARAKSYINPDTGRLDAPGLGNTMPNVIRDQTRRTEAIADSLEQRHLSP